MTLTTTRRRIGFAIIAMVLAASIATIAAGQLWLRDQRQGDARRDAALVAAESTVTSVLSYDYRRLEQDVDETTPLLTGDAKSQYLDVQTPLERSAPRLKAVVVADVKSAAVLDADDQSATVLLFVNQTSGSRKLSEPQLDQSRIVVTLERIAGEWLIATLAAI